MGQTHLAGDTGGDGIDEIPIGTFLQPGFKQAGHMIRGEHVPIILGREDGQQTLLMDVRVPGSGERGQELGHWRLGMGAGYGTGPGADRGHLAAEHDKRAFQIALPDGGRGGIGIQAQIPRRPGQRGAYPFL